MDARQLQSQFIGFMLALGTAVGCIAYEKVVKSYSYGVILWLNFIYYSMALAVFMWFDRRCLSDIKTVTFTWNGAAFVYLATSFTSILWYVITKRQSVMAGGIYELKYIVMLAIIYLFWGDKAMTLNTVIGIVLSLASIYFISK